MKKHDIKRCPFCGGMPSLDKADGGARVTCMVCFAKGPYFATGVDICAADEAVAAWNRRSVEDE